MLKDSLLDLPCPGLVWQGARTSWGSIDIDIFKSRNCDCQKDSGRHIAEHVYLQPKEQGQQLAKKEPEPEPVTAKGGGVEQGKLILPDC
ncbi:hypothetical protein ACLKA6_011293 [Drosophila palustris]